MGFVRHRGAGTVRREVRDVMAGASRTKGVAPDRDETRLSMLQMPARPLTLSGPALDPAPLRGSAVNLGHEPPLSRDGERAPLDRRSISLRWLAGTVLTGLFGAGLIGSAIWVSLDGEVTFAERAELAVTPTPKEGTGERSPRRGDRLFTQTDIVSAKQAFRTPTTIRIGDREVIKIKPFVRVATNLALGSLGFSDDVPAFNPMKLYASGVDTPAEAAPLEPSDGDAEVSVQKRPLGGYSGELDTTALSIEQVQAQVAEERKAAANAGSAARLPLASQLMLTRALSTPRALPDSVQGGTAGDIAFSTIQVTFVPENVTTKAKTPAPDKPVEARSEERVFVVKRSETLEAALRNNGIAINDAHAVQVALTARLRETPVHEGTRVKVLTSRSGEKAGWQLLRVSVYEGEALAHIAAINDRNEFVSVAPPQTESPASASEDDEETDEAGTGLRLYDSLYETGFKHDIPRQVIDQIVKICFYDFDLQKRVTGGDSFEIFYSEDEEAENRPELLTVSLSVSGTTKHYYRYQSGDDGIVDYFDEEGRSNRKFLIRKPIAEGILRSTFGMRYHPVLRYSRMHTGIDWANKVGTPIIAAGDGRVRVAGWESGYGRRVEIEHPYNFVTTYNHMSAFAKGIKEGVRVRQGQVIGYLGSSGLSTGPHLHYEVLINENFVDPLSVKVPRNRELDALQLAAFKRERDRIDDLVRKAPTATKLAERSR
jgi:murein DD-endopeptidase MepM/ murein hydrolase activator NlpD